MRWLRTLLVGGLFAGTAAAADWPQFLGPNRNGSTSEKVVPWKGELKILWRQPVGEGHSSPVVADGVVYLHYKLRGEEAEALQAFDATTGKPRWQTSYPRFTYKGLFGSGPRATPSVAGDQIFTHGITGLVTCFDKGGKKIWQVDTQKDLKAPKLFFGASSSPLVHGDQVVVLVGAEGASLVAFQRRDGKIAWKALDDRASYSSPVILGTKEQPQLVALTQKRLVSVHPTDGKLYWDFALKDKLSESSSTPVVVGRGVLVASSITYGSVGLKMESKENKPAVEKLWFKEELNCYFSTPVGVGTDQLYVVTGTKPPALATSATLRCVDPATGKEYWNRPNVGKYHASLLRTGNNKLLMLEEKGDLVLLEPDVKAYRELARAKVCGDTWAHPARANGRLYVRDSKELICVQLAP